MVVEKRYNTDLLTLSSREAQLIAQQCNCTASKGKGLSKSIADRFPYADFYSKRTQPSTPGTIEIAGKEGQRKIIALYAQYAPGKAYGWSGETPEERERWFAECLDRIGRIKNLRSIAFPMYIGCGLAGGNWSNYEALITAFAAKKPNVKVLLCSNMS